jgi:GntR family transcriptional regulator/MocR family aminotransferase
VRARPLALALDRADATPAFLQIARAIAARVRAGALPGGAPLPSSRTLARDLGVHRNTVLAAYDELRAEGWIDASPARGTFVSRELPAREPRTAPAPPAGLAGRAGFALPPAPGLAPRPQRGPGAILLLGGVPDVRLVPAAALARAYRRALRRCDTLDYGDARGHPRLRAALAARLAETRGMAAPPDGIVVTRGAQMAIALVGRALLAPGDAVAVEALGYAPAWSALRLAGLRLVPVPVDAKGLDVAALAARVGRERIRAVYLTPHHQYPTTVALAPARRLALLDLARRERLLVVEDDYDHEFHYEGRPLLPLASADTPGSVVYVGTLSKVLAPGLRLGFVAAPLDAAERIAAHRAVLDRQGDLAVEAAVADLLEEGEVQRHVWRTRRIYAERREALDEALRAELGGALSFALPPGGMAFWCRTAPGIDAAAWADRAEAAGVAVQAGRTFAFDGRPLPFLRLGFGREEPRALREGVRRLAAAAPPQRSAGAYRRARSSPASTRSPPSARAASSSSPG